jgi:flavin reductase (DIM6/NTAB) family NADH-FMN oxidoreductase RutF
MTGEFLPAIDPQAFRKALGQFPTGVCVVSCTADGECLGMTMSSFNSVSLDPPLVLFSIDRRAASLPVWLRAKVYAINVLSESQKDISNRFAKPHSNKWEAVRLANRGTSAPVLSGIAAFFECVPWSRYEAGDHSLFLAEVKCFMSFTDRMPLVFSQGRYASLQRTDVLAPLRPLDLHY